LYSNLTVSVFSFAFSHLGRELCWNIEGKGHVLGACWDIWQQAIKGMWDKVQLATKFGFVTGESLLIRGDPEWVRTACEGSLKRLDVEYIDLYYQHCIDAKVPIEVTVSISLQPNLECLHDKHPC